MATPVLMPKQGNSVESCLIIEWKKKLGDKVNQGEILLEVETDKAVIEVESPVNGVLLQVFYQANDDVPVQSQIAMIGEAGEQLDKATQTETKKPSKTEKSHETKASNHTHENALSSQALTDKIAISPRAKKLAQQEHVDALALQGSGPQGRILERDVLAALKSRPADLAAKAIDGEPEGVFDRKLAEGVKVIPLTAVRRRIAGRMLESLQTTAQLTLNTTADARELLHYRAQFKQSPPALGARDISINDILLFAVSRALLEYPFLNATFEDDTMYQYSDVNLGFAVDTPRGLLVPVIHKTQSLNLKSLSQRAKSLAKLAQEGKIKPEDLQGASFTLSNLPGVFGIESFTPCSTRHRWRF
ncbi:MAG: dihydrolipoamide acetyltransferase family protein [Deinococcales bacterium]